MSKLIKEIMDALNAVNQNKTEPYDRQGEVKRIEDKIAWVKLEGSDRETPIQMTIACDVGDTVQARIGGGSAWLTGNLTAPPTDDKKANEAISMVTTVVQEVQEQVEEALEEATDVEDVTMQYCLSDSSSTFVQYGDWSDTPPEYVSGKYYWVRSVLVDDDGNETYGEPRYSQETQLSVETSRAYATTNAHFWYDNTGAYVTDSTQTAYKADATGKYATRVTPTGILQSYSIEAKSSGSWVFSIGGTIAAKSTGSYMGMDISSNYSVSLTAGTSVEIYNGSTQCAIFASGTAAFNTVTASNKITASGDITTRGILFAGTLYAQDNTESTSATANTHYGASSTYSGYYKVGLVKSSSSRRYKHDIKPIENDDLNPHNLYDLGVVQFIYNKDYLDNEKDDRYDRPVAGFVAEEMREIYPTAVDMENGRPETWNPRYIIPPMLALIQEQNKRITELEKRVL